MRKLVIIFILLVAFSSAAISRLYIGEDGGQPMAGVDTRINIGPVFVGGDIKTVIRKMVVNEDDKVIGFMPDRTDYKISGGISLGNMEIEYAHTCYHRVISNSDISYYEGNINFRDTDTIAVKMSF